MVDGATAGLVALCAFDVGIYARAALGATGNVERLAEPVATVATAATLGFVLLVGGTFGGFLLVTALWSRAGWDLLHLGDGNVLQISLPRDYALLSLLTKGVLSGVYLLFAFPA